MSNALISNIELIGSIIGLLAVFISSIHSVAPALFRFLIKPKITTKVTFGKKSEVRGSVTKDILFVAKDTSIWLTSNRNVELSAVTFRRLCRCNDKCLLFRFFWKSGILKDSKWCVCGSVDDIYYPDAYLKASDEAEKRKQFREFFQLGKLKLIPKENIVSRDSWVVLDVPLKLRNNKRHNIIITLSVKMNYNELPYFFRLISNIFGFNNKIQSLSYSISQTIPINCLESSEKVNTNTEIKNNNKAGFQIAFSYNGLSRDTEFQKIMDSLVQGINANRKNPKPPARISVNEMRNLLKDHFPQTETTFSEPPDKILNTFWDEEELKNSVTISSNIMAFSREFLDCESYSSLNTSSMKCFLLLPDLLNKTYLYLTISSVDPFATISKNVKNNSEIYIIQFIRALYYYSKVSIYLAPRKRQLIKATDLLAVQYKSAKL